MRVTMVDKNKAVVCCLLSTSAIMLSENKKKSKMWSKMWYLKRNISCDAHLQNELLETDMLWDDGIVVSAGNLRKLWDSLSEMRSSLCEKRLERTFLRSAPLTVKTAQFNQFFPPGMTSHSKISQFNWECIARLRIVLFWLQSCRGANKKNWVRIWERGVSIYRTGCN